MTYRPVAGGTRHRPRTACTLTTGLPMTGTATLADDGSFGLAITIDGQRLHFRRDAAGVVSVSGIFEGKTAR